MPEHVVPEDREGSDNKLHKNIRKEIQELPDTTDDKAFTKGRNNSYFKKKSTRKRLQERTE